MSEEEKKLHRRIDALETCCINLFILLGNIVTSGDSNFEKTQMITRSQNFHVNLFNKAAQENTDE